MPKGGSLVKLGVSGLCQRGGTDCLLPPSILTRISAVEVSGELLNICFRKTGDRKWGESPGER